jgi:predicted 3-demethylubiquinone-9 3-methyltransferase (glyoxalase superfamily)
MIATAHKAADPVTRITPCLWFDDQAEQAARFYTGIFPNSRIGTITLYGREGFDIHHRPAGSVMTVEFALDGQPFTALNGGPLFRFNEALSLQVDCETQAQVDHFWDRLSEGGDPTAQQCGWLKDRYGVSWQIVPAALRRMLRKSDGRASDSVMKALLQMKKLDIAALQRAYALRESQEQSNNT